MDELVKRELIDGRTRDLFNTPRKARNVASHGGSNRRITPGEALDYNEHSLRLTSRLSFVLGQVEAEAKFKKNLRKEA
jgi:hypothetical protein